MQNTMLDSAVSSNSQELSNASSAIKLFENPLFRVRVIMRLGDPWVVAKDVATCIEHSNVSKMCELCRDKDKVVESASNFDSNDLLESGNARITLISESGLYRILAKCNLPKCEPFENWVFDEVLPSIRKTGSYSVQAQSAMLPNFCNPAEAARAWADLYEKNQAIELRALSAEAERDEAIRTKAMIGSRREATAMATASAKSRECNRLTTENEELKDAVGRGTNWCTVSVMKSEWKREFGHEPVWQKLMKFSVDLPTDMQPVKDVDEKVVLRNGSEKFSKVYRYHVEAWTRYRQYEENLRATKNLVTVEVTEEVF